MLLRMVYDDKLAQAAYLIACQKTGEAIVIDPERDVDRYIALAEKHDLRIVATAETHIHADFVSGSRELAERLGAKVYVSDEGDENWKYQWLNKKSSGGSYDYQLLKDGDVFHIGEIEFRVMHTPGHTPEHICFIVTDRGGGADQPIGIATGDFVFVGDLGRPDLLETAAGQTGAREPAARQLFQTVAKLKTIPEFTQVWPAHGAGSACGKSLGAVPTSTIGYEHRFNSAIRHATDEQSFVDFILSGQPEPPLYFATMKRVNKVGPKVLGELPIPPKVAPQELRRINPREVAIVDTRPWEAFRDGHVPGSLCLPLTSSFPTDAGSFIREDEDIYLIVSPDRVEEAVRDLIRIGLDNINGWADASELELYEDASHTLVKAPEETPEEARKMLDTGIVRVLDVRRATEFAEGHLPGAINIAHTRLAARLDEVPRDHQLLVNCRSGGRSARATSYLMRMGYQAINLKGGYLAWEETHPQQA